MDITYLDNSGFYVALPDTTMVFDYYNEKSAGPDALEFGVVTDADVTRSPNTYVFATHNHFDHYNPRILKWRTRNPDIHYIMDSGINPRGGNITRLSEGEVYEDEKVWVKAFGSTDIGVSFLVKAEDKTLFHAGDLNFWHWEEEANADFIEKADRDFTRQVEALEAENAAIDVMFFPCDYRMGKNGDLGARRMIEALKPAVFIPMHFQNRFDRVAAFKKKAETRDTSVWAIPRRGAQLRLIK